MSTQDPGVDRDPAAAETSSHALPDLGARPPAPSGPGGDPADAGRSPQDLASTSEQAPAPGEEPEGTAPPGDEPAAVGALPTGSALLVVQRGPNQGARFLLDALRTTAGRNPDSDIFLDDVTVSRRHAEFLREGTGEDVRFVVRDAGSLNGTYVNRDRVDEVELAAGDEVQVGKYRLVFHPSSDADVPGATA